MSFQTKSPSRRCSISQRHRLRRGHASVEYAMLLLIAVSITGAFAVLQRHAFQPVASASLFDGNGTETEHASATSSALTQQPQTGEQDIYLAFAMLSVIAVGASCVALRFHRKAKRLMQADETRAEGESKPASADPTVKLKELIFDKRSSLLTEMNDEIWDVLEGNFEVYHVMSTKKKVVAPDVSAEKVRQVMTKNKMHHMMVCEAGQLVGVISDRDLVKTTAKTASDLMTSNPITVAPSNCLIPTVSTMINKRISCLPVTVDGELKGVLTRTDLLVAFQCMLQLMSKLQQESEYAHQQLTQLNAASAAAC